jgi:hypothetical protein
MENQNRPFFPSPESVSPDVSNEVENQQKHDSLKPFASDMLLRLAFHNRFQQKWQLP